MERKLQEEVERLYSVAILRNLSDENPIKITVENPNKQGATVVVISVFEPYVYPLPSNVVWICVDPRTNLYKIPLKRTSKTPTPSRNWQNSWAEITTFYDFFHPDQYYDPGDVTPQDTLNQIFQAHVQNTTGNVHHVTAAQAEALPLTGGTLVGPLFLSRSPIGDKEAAPKSYVDQVLTDLAEVVSQVHNYVTSLFVRVDTLESDYEGLVSSFNAYQRRVNRVEGYRFVKTSPNIQWLMQHNMNSKFVSFRVYMEDGEEVWPDTIKNLDDNTTVVSFLQPVSGYAVGIVVMPT